MKRLLLFVIAAFSLMTSFGQGSIDSFSVEPANPTTIDTVYVYANSWFGSGGCPLDYLGHAVNGNTILAAANHCVGLATVICGATDTFKIDPLPAGTYTFDMSLLVGSLPLPCQTSLMVVDQQSTSFTVTPFVGVQEYSLNDLTFENPVSGRLNFPRLTSEWIDIYDITGTQIQRVALGANSVDFSGLIPGIYFLRSNSGTRKMVVQ